MGDVLMEQLNGNPIPWLLENDPQNPGVRYFALLELLDMQHDDGEVLAARENVMAVVTL